MPKKLLFVVVSGFSGFKKRYCRPKKQQWQIIMHTQNSVGCCDYYARQNTQQRGRPLEDG